MLTHKLIVALAAMTAISGALWLMACHAGRRLEELGHSPELVTTRPKGIPKEMLIAVERAEHDDPEIADNPPLEVGDECFFLGYNLIKGCDEPWPMLVVDANEAQVVASWAGGGIEQKLSRTVVRRYGSGGGKARGTTSLPAGDAGLAKSLPRS
jgi:hypothetical protein